MHALHGVRLVLDQASAHALSPWLDSDAAPASSPSIEIRLDPSKRSARPAVLELLLALPSLRLSRTTTGFVVEALGGSWLAVEGQQISGALSYDAQTDDCEARNLVINALMVALQLTGVYELHAAAACIGNERALVLVGDSGAGKSTTTTALISAGCQYLGDDGLLIRNGPSGLELHAISPSFRLTEEVVSTFSALEPHLSKPETSEKWLLDASSAFPGQRLGHWSGPIALLFLSHSKRSSTTLSPLDRADAMGLLLAQSSGIGLDWHSDPRRHLDVLASLTNQSQIARLELGSEWLEDPLSSARRLIERARSLPPPSPHAPSRST